jgi:hypothetical protein
MSVHDETFDYDKALAAAKDKKSTQKLKTLTKRLFQILDTKEESDSGQEFSPVFISCCRVLLGEELNKILPKMKELAND